MSLVSTARRKRLVAAAVAMAVAIGLVLYLVLAADDDDDRNASLPAPTGPLPTLDTSGVQLDTQPPPWDPPIESLPFIHAAGLDALPRETLDVHYHAHLDVIVDGVAVVVPSGIGYVLQDDVIVAISPLHTHDINGVVHVESPTDVPYTLGQFFVEWAVRFDRDCVGGLCTGNGKAWRVYVDGDQLGADADPTTIVFRAHQQIALWYGDADADAEVPRSYDFAPGQ